MSLHIHGVRIPKRLIATSLLFTFAVVLAVLDPSPARLICVPAMLLSSLGDILLMDFRPITTRLPFRGFIPGAISFGISHLVYSAAFLTAIVSAGKAYWNGGVLIGLAALLFSAGMLTVITVRKKGDVKMLLLEMIYLFVICLNIASASSAASAVGGKFILCSVGAVIFLVSDMFILASEVCRQSSARFKVPIWITYAAAQILLLAGA